MLRSRDQLSTNQGSPDGLELGDLLLDGGVDLVEGGDPGQLLGDLLVVGSLLGMLSELTNIQLMLTSIHV